MLSTSSRAARSRARRTRPSPKARRSRSGQLRRSSGQLRHRPMRQEHKEAKTAKPVETFGCIRCRGNTKGCVQMHRSQLCWLATARSPGMERLHRSQEASRRPKKGQEVGQTPKQALPSKAFCGEHHHHRGAGYSKKPCTARECRSSCRAGGKSPACRCPEIKHPISAQATLLWPSILALYSAGKTDRSQDGRYPVDRQTSFHRSATSILCRSHQEKLLEAE